MDHLSNQDRFTPQLRHSSGNGALQEGKLFSAQTVFPGSYLPSHDDSSKRQFYPTSEKDKKDPLEIPYHQKVAFAMTVLSLASSCLGGRNASLIGYTGMAFQVGLSLFNFSQNPSISNGMPIGMMALQTALSFTPINSALPYLNLLLQGRSTYAMSKDCWNQIGLSLQNLTQDNYAIVGRNLFVYGINALSSGYNLYRGYQNTYTIKESASEPSPADIENAKQTLCKGLGKCPTDWTPKEIKRLYRKQSLSAHPDKTGSDEAFNALTKARDILLSIFKAPPVKQEATAEASSPEPTVETSSSFGLQQIQESISSWGDSLWGFFNAFDKYLSLPVAGASEASERTFSLGPVLNNRALAHVLGDPYIGGTNLEGSNLQSTMKTLVDLSADASADLRREITALAEKIQYIPVEPMTSSGRHSLALKIADQVQKLNPGEDLWMEGGWRVKRGIGHSMLYQWIKRQDGDYDIYIYNTGAGLEYHDQEIKKEVLSPDQSLDPTIVQASSSKKKVLPYVKFKGVPGSVMGFLDTPEKPPSLFEGLLGAKVPENNPVLFEKLIEVKEGIDENEPEKQIYLEIFGTLNDYRDVDGDEGDFLVPPQISGTCSWYVLVFAALRKYLKNIDNLEKVDFERDEKAFESSCSSYTSDPTKRELCIRGGHKLLLDLAKLHENGIRHEDVENKREKIQDALDLLAYEGESTCSFSEELEIISSRNNPYSMLAKRFPSHVWDGWEPNVLSSGVTSQTTPFSSHFLDVQQIDNLIKESNRILTFSGGSTHDIPMRIEQLVKRLPRPSQFHTAWKGASPDQIRTSIEVLSNVLTKYTSDVFSKPGRLLTEQNTAWALLATIHHLSTRLNDDLQSKYGIHHATFTQLIQDPFFTNFRREDVEFYQEIASYFKSLPQDLLLFDQSKSLSVIRESDIQNRISDEVFLEDIEQKHTKIAQQIQVEISKMEENYPSIPTWMIKRLIYRTKNDIFANHQETSFISSLRMAVYSAAAYNSYLYTSPNFSKYPIHLHSITDTDKSINFSSDWVLSSLGGMKYLMPDKYAFSNLDVSSHCLFNVDSNLKENLAVSPKLSVRNGEIDSALDVTGCQKTLQSQLLVDYAKDNIETLSDEIMQNTMLLQLFKTYPSGTPIHEDMKNPHFIVSVSELIEKGLSKFWKNRLSPDIKTTLFFLQIARRIKELDPQVSLRDFSSDINQLLKLDMKNEERIALHMHRILQYTTQKDALCALEKSETAENVALKEILTSWMYVSSHSFHSWHDFHSQSEVVHFIHDLAPIFENLSEDFLHALISDLMPSHNSPFTVVAKPYPELATYLAQDQNGETWSINPLHGKIYRGKEPFQIGLQKDFSTQQAYRALFGDQKFKLIKEGAAFVFQDSHQNTFRIFENGTNIIIQMQFEGEWYQHVTKENGLTKAQLNLLLESVPKAMLSDHFVFRSKDKTLFVHKDTFSIDFIDFQGTSQGGKSALFEHEYLYPWTEDFEKKSWILERVYEDGKFHIEFPRFVSTNGRTLEFEGKFGQIFWKENPTFALAKMMPGFLGLCSNYLLLHDGEKSKLLVPVKPVLPTSKEFKPHCVLDIGDEARLREYANNENSGPYTGELNSPQLKQHHFIEYDIEDGQAKPLNLEGALFLAYLFLAQKSYSQALKILKEDLNIKAHLTHTPLSKKIILQIVTHPIFSYDQSANSIAFALKALLLLPKEEWPDNSQGLWIQYQNGLNGVQADLRLSTQDRNQFIKRYGEQNQEISSQETRWNWRIQNGMNKYDMASLMRLDYGSIIKFIEVYNAFRQAKTREEKIFLRLKYLDYFKKGSYYLPAIKAVVEGDGSKFSPYPTQKVSRDEGEKWLEQFEEADDIILVSPRSVRSKKTARTASQGRTLADSLYKIKAHHPQEPFALGSIDLVENGFVNNLMQTSFLEETTPTRQSYLDEARLFNQPIPELYESAVAKERADFIHEYNEGMRKNQEEKQFSLQAGETLEQVHKKITAYLKDLNPQALKHEILKLVNRLPDDEQQRTLTLLLEGGQAKSKVRMHETINCFLEGKSEGYLALNSHLTEEEIRRLDHLVQEFLVVSIEAAYMEKALKINNPQELGLHLSQGTEYISSEYDSLKRQFLVYEYRAGLRMRREQVALILKMAEKKSCVTQLMMGGGKTSVLASNLLYLSAKPGRISFFIPPAAQFSTLKENLGNMQKRHFHQEVVPIQIKRDQLDEENLKWIKEQFLAAKTSRKVILTTRESIESIVLEYLDLLGKGNADDEKLQLLSFLVKEMKEFGDVLVDEVDLILNPMQETNFPFGSKVSIEPQLIDMTRQLFTLLSSPKFEEKIRLRSNQQAVLTERESREILSEVLKEFFDECKELDLEPSEKAAFLEFISGKETGRSFRQLLELKAQSKKLRASAEEISLLKHLSSDIFPLTLSKSTGEGYGRVLEDISVGPYHGVNSPSFTEFGSQWEAMAYHFQTVLSKGVTPKQLQDLYKHFFKSAGFTSELTGTMLEETWEAKAFQKLTGYSFAEFPTHEQEALDVVNQDPKTQLYIEANSIANLVGYYTKYFRSTSQNFAASFSGFDSFSGTPWNPESFPRDLEENFHPDVGTEGKIIDEFLERAQKKSLEVFTTTSIKPKETLAQVLSAMKPKRRRRVHGFIDSGGLFKENTGLSVAQEILDFYAKDDLIESVLFFDRPDPLSPMVLMALKKGDPTPIIIGSTQPKEIAKHGIKLYSTFVYYDQTHCEATDILQKSDAINLISVNHRTIRRTLTQGILRLRGYFKGQDVEVVIPKEEQAHFTADGSNPTHQDILLKTIDNQAVRKADQTFRSYRQKVDHALREIVMEKLRAGNSIQEEIAIFERFQDVLMTTKDHDLYAQFGSPEVSIDSLEALIEYCDQKKILFKRLANEDSATYRKAELLLSQIIESAEQSPYRPSRVKKSLRADAGTEVEIAQEAEVKEEIDHSVLAELESYQTGGFIRIFREPVWTLAEVNKGFEKREYTNLQFFKKDSSNVLFALRDVLSDQTFVQYRRDFSSLFTDRFLVSRNFLRTNEYSFSNIFDKNCKPARQILVVKEKGQFNAILISTAEADFFKNYIKDNSPENIWLLLPDGRPFVGEAPEMTPDLKDLLWQANLFNGNVKGLLAHEMTPKKRKKLDPKLLHDFLLYKSRTPEQRDLLESHFVEKKQVGGKEKDSLSAFRPMTNLEEEDSLEDYSALIELGISQKDLQGKNKHVKEALLKHIEAVRRLHDNEVDISSILNLPTSDLIKVLENVDSLIVMLWKGVTLPTFLKIITSSKKSKSTLGDKK